MARRAKTAEMMDVTTPALHAYAKRIGAEQLNFRRYMVKTYSGHYYTERSLITIDADGEITCSNELHAPTKMEADSIRKEVLAIKWPKAIEARDITALVKEKKLKDDDTFTFYNRSTGGIIMVQHRLKLPDGVKRYVPYTFFDDGQWRAMEPDGLLPFWKPKKEQCNHIMVHEGAKAARFVDWLVNDKSPEAKKARDAHPWIEFLSKFEHWGMIGGALAPHRTDYSELHALKPVSTVYVADNDTPGKEAVKVVSEHYKRPMKAIIFDTEFPTAWDLADPIPKDLFKNGRFIGKALESRLIPATWATDKVIIQDLNGNNRQTIVLRKDFVEEWTHTVQPELYMHVDNPSNMLSATEFNNAVAPFSDSKDTALLVRRDLKGKALNIIYDPSARPGIIRGRRDSKSSFNTHEPGSIKPEKMDVGPFLEYIERLVPSDKDRPVLLKWIATLIACPHIHMSYGLLMISEVQGVGKSTLGEKILTPLIGHHNVSFPGESDIVMSEYNAWCAHKRLAVVHEIYAGNSSKAYNRLKNLITDRVISINKKYMANYQTENWMHIYACSNSLRALRLATDDRRWFVPGLTDKVSSSKYWDDFNEWLNDKGGLNGIMYWAHEYVKKHGHVGTGDHAPDSEAKNEMLVEGLSPGAELVWGILENAKAKYVEGGWTTDRALVSIIRDQLYDGKHVGHIEKPALLRKLAQKAGLVVGKQKLMVDGWRNTFTITLPPLYTIDTQEEIKKYSDKRLDLKGLIPLG